MGLLKRPSYLDVALLSACTVLITLHPYYLYGQLNLFELGIYLPGINALLDGHIPYRDFFHLRGPLELYIPALMMSLSWENVGVLATYFYGGTVLTLIIGVFIAKELYRTRFVLYLAIPIFIARTFPRVAFTFWGGMRYGFGLLAILLAILAFKHRKFFFILLSGIVSSLALLTSVDVGACATASIMVSCIFALCFSICERAEVLKLVRYYVLGLAIILFPYSFYLFVTKSLVPYLDSVYSVIHIMLNIFPDSSFTEHPHNFIEIILAMSPWNPHFKHLTPVYCYLFFLVYLIITIRKSMLKRAHLPTVLIAIYGFTLYALTFRKLGAMQFEMALQPEKLLLFVLLEELFLFLRILRIKCIEMKSIKMASPKQAINAVKISGLNFLIFAFVMSSLGYSIARYNHRFFAFKYAKNLILHRDIQELMPLAGEESEKLELERVRGLTVPSWQAEDINKIAEIIRKNTKPEEPVFMFPELGAYSFIADRPFVGRFPMATFSWFGDWHEELLKDLKESKPNIVVLSKDPGPFFEKVYFQVPKNRTYYEEITNYIAHHYILTATTHSLLVYRRE